VGCWNWGAGMELSGEGGAGKYRRRGQRAPSAGFAADIL